MNYLGLEQLSEITLNLITQNKLLTRLINNNIYFTDIKSEKHRKAISNLQSEVERIQVYLDNVETALIGAGFETK